MSVNDNHTKTQNGPDQGADQVVDLANEPDFQLGALSVRPSSREVVLDGQTEMLEPRVLQVLTVLARRRGEVVSRDQLVESCWGGRVVSEDAVNRSITKVRRWSMPATFTLETIPRVGYRLEAAAKPASAATVTPVPPVVVATPRRYSKRKKILLGVAAVFTLFLAVGLWFGVSAWRDSNRPFFTVLQFDAGGTDADAVALADAITAAINHRLAEQGFRVVSPTVSSQYRGARKSEAGALGSRYLIDGSVRREGTRFHVAARIDATERPVTIWSREFNLDAAETREIPEKLGVILAGLFGPNLQSGPILPPKVAAGMLRINALRVQGNDMDAYVAARLLLRQVPTHYTPQIWYATSVGEALDLFPSTERVVALNAGRQAAERAEQMIIGTVPSLRYALTPTVEWSAREKPLRKGIDTNNADGANTRFVLAAHLVNSGQITEAVDMANQAVVMNRLASRYVALQISVLDVAGRKEQADKALADAQRIWPGLEPIERLKFSNAIARGDVAHASNLLQDPIIGPLVDPPAENRPYAAMLRALATRNSADIAEVERGCTDPSKLARDRASWCLQVLVTLGRHDAFFDMSPAYFPEQRGATAAEREARWLEAPRVGRYARVLFRSDMKAIRADPRFIPIVERLGLLDYWRSSGRWPDFCKTEPESVCSRMQAQ